MKKTRTTRRTEPTEEEMGQKQKVNVWRSLMSLQFLSDVPLGPEHGRIGVYAVAR